MYPEKHKIYGYNMKMARQILSPNNTSNTQESEIPRQTELIIHTS